MVHCACFSSSQYHINYTQISLIHVVTVVCNHMWKQVSPSITVTVHTECVLRRKPKTLKAFTGAGNGYHKGGTKKVHEKYIDTLVSLQITSVIPVLRVHSYQTTMKYKTQTHTKKKCTTNHHTLYTNTSQTSYAMKQKKTLKVKDHLDMQRTTGCHHKLQTQRPRKSAMTQKNYLQASRTLLSLSHIKE